MLIGKVRRALRTNPRIGRLILVLVLLILVSLLSLFLSKRGVLEEPKILIPLDPQVEKQTKSSREAKEIEEVIQKFFYNSWLSNQSRKNGGWNNVLPLMSESYASKIRDEQAIQNAISIGSIAEDVKEVKLVKEESRLFDLQIENKGKDKNKALILADVKFLIDRKQAKDYYLQQQMIIYLTKVKSEWRIYNIFVYAAREEPAELLPGD